MAALIFDAAAVAALGAPVLCADTCSVLDMMRTPTREGVQAHERLAALALVMAMEGGTQLIGLKAEQVVHELDENQPGVEDETEKSLTKLKAQLARIDAVAAAYGASGKADIAHLDDHLARALAVVARWRSASHLVQQKMEIAGRALVRVNQGRTPADKGKQAMKDCVVIETYLDAVRELRATGLTAPIVFASSNTKDYAQATGTALKSDLAKEFAGLNMAYAPNLAAAKHMLGL